MSKLRFAKIQSFFQLDKLFFTAKNTAVCPVRETVSENSVYFDV